MKRLMAAIGLVLAVAGTVRAQNATQDKIYSRQKAFRIPFQIPDPAEQKQLQEVQLFVARNGGRWEKYTGSPPDVPPDKRSFTFRTDQDGEYWFAVRTMDKRGVQNPEEDASLQAGLRVVVDSEVPKIELRPLARSGREVGIEWEVQDRNLDLDTLKLEYRIEGQENWQAVPGVVPRFVGQATWTPDSQGNVSVRCQVQDRAQNLGIQSIDLDGEAGSPAIRGLESNVSDTTPSLKPFNRKPEVPVGRPASPPNFGAGTKRETPIGSRFGDPKSNAFSNLPAGPGPDETPPTKAPATNAFNNRSVPPATATAAPANRQIVSDPEVSLDYEIEDEGPSGVSVIELWVTTDMGRTWKRLGEDPDRKSPFEINLGGDGLYGLTLVAKSGVGLGDRPPISGDQPQTWIEVDKTPPQVQLFTPEVGKGIEMGNLIVTWKADDSNLGDRCVSLFYAEPGKTDWKPIAAGIENSGRYTWKLGGQAPFRFRVAIEVADLAGNRQMAESTEVSIDTSKPKSKINGVNSGRNYR